MKAGLSTACFNNFSETENAIRKISQSGACVSEVYLRTFYEYRPEFARRYAGDTAVYDICVNPDNFEAQLFSPSRRVSGDGYYWLDQTLRSAQLFGCKNFLLRGSAHGSIDEIAGYLGAITRFCARYGVNAVLSNSVSGIYGRPSVFGELKNRCPALSGALDLKEAYLSGYPYTMYLKDMSGAISLVRIADVDGNGGFCLPGRGGTDFYGLFSRLKEEGFDGAVIVDAPADDAGEIERSLEYINNIIYNVK